MENITFNLLQQYRHGDAFPQFLALRKRTFVDGLGWDIPHDEAVEMDQYDNPRAWYSLVLRDGAVVGGARAMATSAAWGSHTYMLRDAKAGKLIDIPPQVMPRDIVSPRVWECTRLALSDSLRSHADRSQCLSMIVDGLIEIISAQGGDEMMSLSPLSLVRALRQLGYSVSRMGEPYTNDDGRRYAVLSMPTGHGAPRVIPTLPHATHVTPPAALHAPAV